MAKIFYTDHDIEDLAKQGVTSIDMNDEIVLTDLARDKARRLGIALISQRDRDRAAQVESTPKASQSTPPKPETDMESRVFSAVKKRLGDQVDDALLRTIVKRVINSLGQR